MLGMFKFVHPYLRHNGILDLQRHIDSYNGHKGHIPCQIVSQSITKPSSEIGQISYMRHKRHKTRQNKHELCQLMPISLMCFWAKFNYHEWMSQMAT